MDSNELNDQGGDELDVMQESLESELFGEEEGSSEDFMQQAEQVDAPQERAADPARHQEHSEEDASRKDAAPNTWRDEAKGYWEKLPPQVKQEIQKREADIMNGIGQYKQSADIGNMVMKQFEPHARAFADQGIDPRKWLGDALALTNMMMTGTNDQKVQVLENLARAYRVQPRNTPTESESFAQSLQELAETDPVAARAMAQLAKQNHYLQQQVMRNSQHARSMQMASQEREEQATLQKVQQFAADPAHPHFNEVAQDVLNLIRSGESDLQSAYDKAVWLNPKVRQTMISEHHRKLSSDAQKSRNATAVNVNASAKSGSPNSSGSTAGRAWDDPESLYELFDEAMRG